MHLRHCYSKYWTGLPVAAAAAANKAAKYDIIEQTLIKCEAIKSASIRNYARPEPKRSTDYGTKYTTTRCGYKIQSLFKSHAHTKERTDWVSVHCALRKSMNIQLNIKFILCL